MHSGYVRAWCDSRSPQHDLTLLMAERAGRVVGVMPVVHRGGGLGSIDEAEEVGIVASDPAAADALATHVLSERRSPLRLRPVAADSLTRAAIERHGARWRARWRAIEERPVLDIEGDWDTFWSSRGGKLRQDIRRRRRRAEEQGDLQIEIVTGGDGLRAALDEALEIEAAGWKGSGGTAINESPEDVDFYHRLATWAAGRGWLRLAIMRLDGQGMAMQFCLDANGVVYLLKMGFDERFSKLSPGKLLLAAEIERCFDDGLRRFDFAGAAASYKNAWASEFDTYGELIAEPAGVVGAARWGSLLIKDWARPRAKRVRDRLRSARG